MAELKPRGAEQIRSHLLGRIRWAGEKRRTRWEWYRWTEKGVIYHQVILGAWVQIGWCAKWPGAVWVKRADYMFIEAKPYKHLIWRTVWQWPKIVYCEHD
jgi:hypothetical protein